MLNRVLAAIPLTAVIAFVTQFTDLLHVPWLTHPDWAPSVNQSIRPIGVISVLLIFLLCYALAKSKVRLISIFLLVATLRLLGVCYWFHVTIDNIATPQAAENAIARWNYAYVAACITLVSAATTIGLWLTAPPP